MSSELGSAINRTPRLLQVGRTQNALSRGNLQGRERFVSGTKRGARGSSVAHRSYSDRHAFGGQGNIRRCGCKR
jgi:hypothetical protein